MGTGTDVISASCRCQGWTSSLFLQYKLWKGLGDREKQVTGGENGVILVFTLDQGRKPTVPDFLELRVTTVASRDVTMIAGVTVRPGH